MASVEQITFAREVMGEATNLGNSVAGHCLSLLVPAHLECGRKWAGLGQASLPSVDCPTLTPSTFPEPLPPSRTTSPSPFSSPCPRTTEVEVGGY